VNGPQREGSAWSVEKTFAGAHLICISTRAVGTRRGAARRASSLRALPSHHHVSAIVFSSFPAIIIVPARVQLGQRRTDPLYTDVSCVLLLLVETIRVSIE